MGWNWGPFGILSRHEKRLDDLHEAMKAHVFANILRLDAVEKQQKDLSKVICNHKDENAQQLERIGAIVTGLDVKITHHAYLQLVIRLVTAVSVLVGVVLVATVCWKRPDSLPYIAQILASAFMKH